MEGNELDALYNQYAALQYEIDLLPEGTARGAALASERDALWQQYVTNGGMHPPAAGHGIEPQPFEVLKAGMRGDRVTDLQQRLGLGKGAQTGEFGRVTQRRLEDWQAHHNLPVTGELDQLSHAILVSLERSSDPGTHELPQSFEVAAGPVMQLVLPSDGHWMLALDEVPERTYCNTFNLGLLALLVYERPKGEPGDPVPMTDLRKLFDDKQAHSAMGAGAWIETDKAHWRPLIRRAPADHKYERASVQQTEASSSPSDRTKDLTYLDTQAEIWRGSQHMVVACRGTQQLPPDAITDVASWEADWPYGPGKVPWGFYRAFELLRSELDKQIKELPSSLPVFVTGHSLGGALATLVACYIRSKYVAHPVQLYTYAQPRTCNLAFAKHYAADPYLTYYRFENPVDPVPMIPSQRMAHDLLREVGGFPDKLVGLLDRTEAWLQVQADVGKQEGHPLNFIQRWASDEANALHSSVDDARRYMDELRFQQCVGVPMSVADLMLTLAPPAFDARHFGVRCSCERSHGRPTVVEAKDPRGHVESRAEVDQDVIGKLLRVSLRAAVKDFTGQAPDAPEAPKTWLERIPVVARVEQIVDGDVKVAINPLAHKMGSYMAYLLYEFSHNRERYLGTTIEKPTLPLSAAPLNKYEPAIFTLHYFSRYPFWGDRGEDKDMQAEDEVVEIW